MNPPTILMDVDGPLTQGFFEAICLALRDEGIPAEVHLITEWDVCKGFKAPLDVTHRVFARLREPGVAEHFAPRAGAAEMLTRLRKWARVVAVTSPLDGSATWASEREVWLHDKLGFLAVDQISVRDKTLVVGDVIVDDKHATISAYKAAWPKAEAILWGEAHNARDSWNPRAETYAELEGLLVPVRGLADARVGG